MKYLSALIAGGFVSLSVYFWIHIPLAQAQRYYDTLHAKCDAVLEEMHAEWSHTGKILFYLMGPLLSAVLSFILFKPIFLKIIVALILSLLTRNLSWHASFWLRKRQLNRIKTQLPDALSLVANALRSGLSLQQGFQMAAEELEPPIAHELFKIISRQQLGKSFDESLKIFEERVPIEEVELLVSSLQTLRETGGNLIETLEIIIHTIHEEDRVRSKIRTFTSQGIAQAVIITAMPFVLAAALYFISPEYIEPLWSHPIGWGLIAFMLFLQACGAWAMKKIITIKV